MTFTDDDLKRLKELLLQATPGEWSWEGYEAKTAPPPTLYAGRSEMAHGLNLLGRLDPDSNGRNNLDTICALVNLAPALLARLEAAETGIFWLKNRHNSHCEDCEVNGPQDCYAIKILEAWRKSCGL